MIGYLTEVQINNNALSSKLLSKLLVATCTFLLGILFYQFRGNPLHFTTRDVIRTVDGMHFYKGHTYKPWLLIYVHIFIKVIFVYKCDYLLSIFHSIFTVKCKWIMAVLPDCFSGKDLIRILYKVYCLMKVIKITLHLIIISF